MARARNIKPGFFTNEVLGVLDPIIGLTFIGLWCLADKDGRLEDRPLRIKAELFPYRYPLDVNGDLTVLEREGFIDRYEVDGVGYIQVVNFHKHQSPHHTEKAKGYPPKPLQHKEKQKLTVKQPLDDGESQVRTRSDSLIPDSLIPDSISPKGDTSTAIAADPVDNFLEIVPKVNGNHAPICPHQAILDLYHEKLPQLVPVRVWNETRRRHLQSLWRGKAAELKWKSAADGIEWFDAYFDFVSQSEFLTGKATGNGDRRPFIADLEWIIKPANFAKVIEGKYHA